MYIFTIKASDAFGQHKMLEIEAESSQSAILLLKKEGFYAELQDILDARKKTLLTKLKHLDWENLFLRVPRKDIHRLIKMVGHSLTRGKTMKQTLEFIAENEDSQAMKKLIYKLIERMEKPFVSQVEIFALYPHYFDEEFLGIIEAGETSSNLGEYLVDYSHEKKKQEEMKHHFTQVLTKRLLTFLFVVGVGIVVIAFVIPQFQSLFGEKLTMPWAMRMLMYISDFILSYAFHVFILTILILVLFAYLTKVHSKIRWKWHDFVLHFPVLGRTLKTYYTAQFAYLLSTLLTKNVDIIKAMNIVIKQTNNVCMIRTYQALTEAMRAGDDLFSAIVRVSESRKAYMISSIVQAAKVGSETATLGATLMDVRNDLSELFTIRLERSIRLFSIIFYAIILLIALFIAYAIGTAIIAFYNNAQNLI